MKKFSILSIGLLVLLIAGCGTTGSTNQKQGNSTGNETKTSQAAYTPSADVLNKFPMFDTLPVKSPNPADTWVVYDKNQSKYVESKSHPTTFQPGTNHANKPLVIGWAPYSLTSDPFVTLTTASMKKWAQQEGVKLVILDNQYPSTSVPLQVADAMVTHQVDAVVSFNVVSSLSQSIMQKYNSAHIPVIGVDVAHPGALFFGADNYEAGTLAAKYLVDYAKKLGWDPSTIDVVEGTDPNVGSTPALRIKGAVDTIKKELPQVPGSHFYEINAGGNIDPAYVAMTSWLTAHPDSHHILMCTINDERAAGMSNALEAAHRANDGIVVGLNGDVVGKNYVEKHNPPFLGTVAFFPDLYGKYLIDMAIDVAEGKPVPEVLNMNHKVIDKTEVSKLVTSME